MLASCRTQGHVVVLVCLWAPQVIAAAETGQVLMFQGGRAVENSAIVDSAPAQSPPTSQRPRTVSEDQPRVTDAATPSSPPSPDRPRRSDLRGRTIRLLRTPDYFSDPFFTIGQVFVSDFFAAAQADIPLAGGGVRPKISENNKALPQDRVYFTYHYFRNSLEADASTFLVGPDRADFSMQQYVFGFEKTFNEGATSLELRLPFCDTVDFFTPNFDLNSGGRAGNAVGIFKNLLFATDSLAVAAGLGVGFPTGSDVHGSVNRTAYTVHNDAVYLLPFIGFVSAPPDSTFYHGFLQFDFAANGNRIDFQDYVSPLAVGSFGRLTDQTLVHLDLAAGRWLYRDACARNFTGCAAVAEVHYSAALGSSDSVGGTPTITTFDFSNAANPRDFLSVTLGLHADFRHRTLLRVGGVLPLMSGESRPFDFEIQAALVRRL